MNKVTNQAVRPDSFVDYRRVVEKVQPVRSKELIEEKQLGSLAITDGWLVLKEYIESLEEDLRGINKSLMDRGASFEEIGRNAVIVELAGELLTKIIQKVEDARESTESARTK